MINYFIVEIRGKNPKYLLSEIFKLKINVVNIKYFEDRILLKVSYDDYKKIKTIKTSYDISILKTSGKKRFYDNFIKYRVNIITLIISFLVCLFLSCFTLFIGIDTSSVKLENLIRNELKNNGITIFSMKRSYSDLERIKEKIKNNNLNTIEWLEIENKGVITKVKLIERVNSSTYDDNTLKDIVASKNGYIRKIYSKQGEVLKNTDDYVRRGEVIISGNIFRNDKVVDRVRAMGKVYAEVWYIVKSNKSFKYLKDNISDKGYSKLVVSILGKDFTVFKIKKDIDFDKRRVIFNNNLFSINIVNKRIHYKTYDVYSDRNLTNILMLKAKESVSKTLDKDEYIISEKVLKKYKYNGKMYVEVFFRTYEDIACEKDIQELEEKEE